MEKVSKGIVMTSEEIVILRNMVKEKGEEEVFNNIPPIEVDESFVNRWMLSSFLDLSKKPDLSAQERQNLNDLLMNIGDIPKLPAIIIPKEKKIVSAAPDELMEENLLSSLGKSIGELINKVTTWKTIEVSDLLRKEVINDLSWLQKSLKQPNFLYQLNKILFSLFPNETNMKNAFEKIEVLGEFQKDALIKTVVFYVINTEDQTQYNKNLERIMRTLHGHIFKMIKHYNDIFMNKLYKEDLIGKFSFNEKQFIDILSRLGLTEGLEDEDTNRIKFLPEIEQALFDLEYFKKNNAKIQIQPKFTEACLFHLWLAWLAVNRKRIKDQRFITGFCSVFADIILGASLPSVAPSRLSSKVKNSASYNEDVIEIKPRLYSQKELVMDVLFNLTRYVAYQFNGDGWANLVMKAGSAQGPILSTAFREEIKGLPAVKKLPIYIQIRELIIQIRAGLPGP